MNDTTKTEPAAPAVGSRLDRGVRRLVEDAPPPACAHPNKVETHFTYGYRWHCPDCKAGGEDWWTDHA